jgi:hypothetical protein
MSGRKIKWQTEEEWTKFGLGKGYGNRAPTILHESKIPEERSWYNKGARKNWLEAFKFDRKTKTKGYWQNWNNVEIELRDIIEQEGEIPSQKRISELGHNDLMMGITRNHGGLNAVRKRMGFDSSRKQNGYWKDWDNVERELKQIIEENNGEFPASLRKINPSLEVFICKYHGGINTVRERMGYTSSRKLDGYWKDWDNVERELREAIENNDGKFPSQRRLSKMGKGSLSNAISEYGGFQKVRERMGYTSSRKSDGYWKDWDNVEEEMREVIENNDGKFPNGNRLREIGKSSLAHAIINHHGGINTVRERMGYTSSRKSDGYWKDWNNVEEEMREVIEENNGEFPTQRILNNMGKGSLVQAVYAYHIGMNAVKKRMGFGENDNVNHLEIILTNYIGGEAA